MNDTQKRMALQHEFHALQLILDRKGIDYSLPEGLALDTIELTDLRQIVNSMRVIARTPTT
jgi:hypothetical protein